MATRTTRSSQVETPTRTAANRKKVPTAENRSASQRMEERKPYKTVVYPRADPLAKGEIRERDEDLDPQIVWKGATLRLNTEQIEELTKPESWRSESHNLLGVARTRRIGQTSWCVRYRCTLKKRYILNP